jgi:YHS domain-containing protein
LTEWWCLGYLDRNGLSGKEEPVIEIPQNANWHENQERFPCRRISQAPCAVCGKAVDQSKPHWAAYIHGGGAYFVTDEEYEALNADPRSAAGQMGSYPVGPECRKAHPEIQPYLTRTKGW